MYACVYKHLWNKHKQYNFTTKYWTAINELNNKTQINY